MNDPGSRHPDRIPVGGIKFSSELVLVALRIGGTAETELSALLQGLADHRINLPYLCHSLMETGRLGTFCVDAEEWFKTENLFSRFPALTSGATVIAPVGILSLFPHRNSFHLLGRVCALFKTSGIPLYSMATSISALSLCTDYTQLDKLAGELQQLVELPENHAPFRPEFVVTHPR